MTTTNPPAARVFLVLVSLLFLSCAAPPEQKVAPPPSPPPKEKLPVAEQEKKSWESYEDILNMTIGAKRRTILPKLELAHRKLIEEYPDSYLAHESYWRLITMNLNDYTPPRVEKAEQIYKEYLERYPNPKLKYPIDDTMARFYYRSNLWKKLLGFCTPYIRKYIKTGELKGPLYLFFYTEAKFFLGDFKEADKGYRTIKRLFPKSQEARISEKRLKEVRKALKKS